MFTVILVVNTCIFQLRGVDVNMDSKKVLQTANNDY